MVVYNFVDVSRKESSSSAYVHKIYRLLSLTIMTTIHRTDLIQVTGRQGGSTVLSLTFTGADSLGDVFRRVRTSAPSGSGVLAVSLRNRTQGWTQMHNLVFRDSPSAAAQPCRGKSFSYPSLF